MEAAGRYGRPGRGEQRASRSFQASVRHCSHATVSPFSRFLYRIGVRRGFYQEACVRRFPAELLIFTHLTCSQLSILLEENMIKVCRCITTYRLWLRSVKNCQQSCVTKSGQLIEIVKMVSRFRFSQKNIG